MAGPVRPGTLTPIAFVDEGLGNSSYLVDLGDGRALAIDPARHPGAYLAEAGQRGLRVAFAVETHLHADFVSGARELAAFGATVLAPDQGRYGFPVRGLHDGDELDLGGLTLRALGTPGHTPEHLAYLLLDGARPVALFSGGALLPGAVARTDLTDPGQTDPLARALWRSLHARILTLPDDLPVYPTHGAGSFCSAPAGGERTTTIGRERAANPLLAAPDEDTFVERLRAGLGTYPPYFLRLREVNRAGPALYGAGEPELAALAPARVRRLMEHGAWVVDAREIGAFAAGHVPGSVSIALRPQFGTWLGWVVPEAAPVIFVLEPGQDRADLVRQARNVGYDQLLGALDGGIAAWTADGLPVERVPLAPVSAPLGTVVDVRQANEFAAGHVPGARHIELGALAGSPVPDGPLALMCAHGERAMTGASLLARANRRDVTVLVGGPAEAGQAAGEDGP
jgi:hydroxyacylglutathione hydrolase